MDRRTVNRWTTGLLAAGLTAALAIYLTAKPVEVDPLLGDPLANKKFRRELRVMGGRANVLAAEFQDWWAGLWQGESLAGTVAVLTVAGTLLFRFVSLLPAAPAEDLAGDTLRPGLEPPVDSRPTPPEKP